MLNQPGSESHAMIELRRTIRYPFVASAEIIDDKSGTHLSTRVTELSLFGCYFGTVSPLPAETEVQVKIVSGLVFFEAFGTVVYSQANLGMGVVFRDVHPYFLNILHGWLWEAEQARQKASGRSVQT
jgi:hypothetical protein